MARPSSTDGLSRVDGRMKVTGAAKYSAEYKVPGVTYAVLVGSTITSGSIKAMDTRQAERAPGVLAVVTYLNSPKMPGYQVDASRPTPAKPGALKIFNDNKIYFNGQPIAMVIADSFERALYASSLVTATYNEEAHQTDLAANIGHATAPRNSEVKRGIEDAYKTAPYKVEQEYTMPSDVHNPMELHALIARWDADDKLTVWDKTQGVKSTQRSIAQVFKIPADNVQVNSEFVGGAFGSALRTWPHEIAAAIGAKVVKRPVKLVLSRADMFTSVGYRPHTWQKIGIGATADGKLVGITHEAIGQTSVYEDFTENVVNLSRFLYACPNVNTRYKIVSLNVNTPAPMRGPGEATGSFALESALDELSYQLNLDPIEMRLRNYCETDPEVNKPFSSKYLKEAYQLGADYIGWKNRSQKPGATKRDGWLVGYGIGSGAFGAHRGSATIHAILKADGSLILESSVTDIGPGTGTAMAQIASTELGIPPKKIKVKYGDSSLPNSPSQGGSAVTATVGSAVYDACADLKKKLAELQGAVNNTNDYVAILKQHNLPQIEVTTLSTAPAAMSKYSMYSWSVHFVEVMVHPVTGVVKVSNAVAIADAGTIVSHKTARSQMIGGAVGGIGMALTEDAVIDHRYGRLVNNNFADYHVPVHADIPQVEALFVNKPDPVINAMGAKGMGEIALIGMAAAIANAVYNATGKRVRDLPITPDKLLS